jgi:hypothetical protein
MRQTKTGVVGSERTLIGLVAVAALAAPAWAYINGGDFHDTLKNFEKSLETGGWAASFGGAIPADREEVAGMLARALRGLPAKDAARIPVEAKREVARIAREAIQNAASNKRQVIEQGRAGPLQYAVGVYHFESYWETNYGGKREVHARRSGQVPFVALKVVPAKDRAGQRP